MRNFAVLAFTIAAFAATPAGAKDKKPIDPNKKSCRREDTTGSIMGGKLICHTQAEWVQIDDASNINARRILDNRNGQSAVRQ